MLIGNLPEESRLFEAEAGGKHVSYADTMLALIEHGISTWLWIHSEDGKNQTNAPTVQLPEHYQDALNKQSETSEKNTTLSAQEESQRLRELMYPPRFT